MTPEILPGMAEFRDDRRVTFQIGKDRAIGAVIAVAALGEVLKGGDHILHLANLAAQTVDL